MRDVDDLKARQKAFVQAICDELGIKYTELAHLAGIDPATLTRFMNNPNYKHTLSHKTVHKIAVATNRPEPPDSVTTARLPLQTTLPNVRVVGTAAAGLWKDVSLIADDYYTYEQVPVVEDARYAGREQYALLVEGNSINRKIQNGEYAICVVWGDLGIDPKEGQFVHVERNRGGLQEATIKLVKIGERGKVELWPHSTDPHFQTPIAVDHSDEDTEVRIRGLVIGKFSHFD